MGLRVGTRERRQREFADREQAFLNAAMELIRADSLLNLQMSKVAERCEYAVGTLYLHFASKEDLILALVTDRVREHVDLWRRVADWKAPTRHRMLAIGVADMIFVSRHPDYFRIFQYSTCEVVWKAATQERRQAFLDTTSPVGNVVVGIVKEAVAQGDVDLRGLSAEELSTGLWSLCAGFHNLVHAEGMLEDFQVRQPYRLMCRHIQNLLNGLAWNPLAVLGDAPALEALIQRICKEVFDEAICAQ